MAKHPLPDTEVWLVVDRPEAVYSGRVPAVVEGAVSPDEVVLDARPLARRAGVSVVVARAVRIDPAARQIHLHGRPPLAYDLASLNLGSTVAGLDTPGVRAHAVATRPIHRLLQALDDRLGEGAAPRRVVVVGAGAAGHELAMTLSVRQRRAGHPAEVTVVGPSGALPSAVDRTLLPVLQERGVARCEGTVVAVEAGAVRLEGGERLESDLTIWATGSAPHALWADSPGLPLGPEGAVAVRPTLQVVGFDDLFAVGDAASFVDRPLPKAGVYAVRQGPVLEANLRAVLQGAAPQPYLPQHDFLRLLNCGDGLAIGHKWGLAFQGAWVHQLKERIDRQFVDRFRVLGPDGVPDPDFARAMPPMAEAESMRCGGCAAKLSSSDLVDLLAGTGLEGTGAPASERVLLGVEAADDVAVVRWGAETLALTVDGFPAFTDDPFLVGQVAARNALGDVLAKGLSPSVAVVSLTAPAGPHAVDRARQAMAGVQEVASTYGVAIVGGHTGTGPQLQVGLTVLAPEGEAAWRQAAGRAGDVLVLSGPVGAGVVWRADGLGLAAGALVERTVEVMLRDLRPAVRAARAHGVRAGTDITGFGLVGHVGRLAMASGLSASLVAHKVPVIEGCQGLWSRGVHSTAEAPNEHSAPSLRLDPSLSVAQRSALFDPVTAGPMLWCVPPDRVKSLVQAVPGSAVVGVLVAERPDGVRVVVDP